MGREGDKMVMEREGIRLERWRYDGGRVKDRGRGLEREGDKMMGCEIKMGNPEIARKPALWEGGQLLLFPHERFLWRSHGCKCPTPREHIKVVFLENHFKLSP